MMNVVTVASSYRYAAKIAKRSGSNFYRSFWLLPSPKRTAMQVLYAFARVTDDFGDSHDPRSIRVDRLQRWRQATARALLGGDPRQSIIACSETSGTDADPDLCWVAHALFPALIDISHRFGIPSQHLLEIIDGVLADQQKTRFDTFEQLEHYCYLVASAVGICCLYIWQFDQKLPWSAAVDCGIAFQLTNILRDLREDAARGRIYLPRQHWAQHGLCEDDMLELRGDARLCCLVREETQRAVSLFRRGWDVYPHVHRDGQPMFSMMWRTYFRLLQCMRDDPAAVTRCRITLPWRARMQLLSQHFVPGLFQRLPIPPLEIS